MVADIVTYLPGDLLVKVDIASMAHSLECRGPFLDHRVVELAAAMPLERKLQFRSGRSKVVLKRAFADLLPPPIKTRSKMGFGVPISRWFRDELKSELREVLLDPVCSGPGVFPARSDRKTDRRTHRRQTRARPTPLGVAHARIVVPEASRPSMTNEPFHWNEHSKRTVLPSFDHPFAPLLARMPHRHDLANFLLDAVDQIHDPQEVGLNEEHADEFAIEVEPGRGAEESRMRDGSGLPLVVEPVEKERQPVVVAIRSGHE